MPPQGTQTNALLDAAKCAATESALCSLMLIYPTGKQRNVT